MRRLLEKRLGHVDGRTGTLTDQCSGDEDVEVTALLMQLTRERGDIADALRDAKLIEDGPFDTEAIETDDTVTICNSGNAP